MVKGSDKTPNSQALLQRVRLRLRARITPEARVAWQSTHPLYFLRGGLGVVTSENHQMPGDCHGLSMTYPIARLVALWSCFQLNYSLAAKHEPFAGGLSPASNQLPCYVGGRVYVVVFLLSPCGFRSGFSSTPPLKQKGRGYPQERQIHMRKSCCSVVA